MVAFNKVDFDTARSVLEQSLALNREVGDRWGTAWALHNFGRLGLAEAELGRADACSAQGPLEESVAIWREIGERRQRAFAVADLAICNMWKGDVTLARTQLDEVLSTFTELEDHGGKKTTLFNCSCLFATEGAHAPSARVFAAARANAVPPREDPAFQLLGERRLERARLATGPELVATALAEGQSLSLDAAVAYARQQLGVSGLAG